jgi:Immunoglobulin domain
MSLHRSMSRSWTVLSLCFGLALAACGGGGGSDAPPARGMVAGTVVASADAAPVAGALISVGALSTSTSIDGRFSLADVPAGERVVLTIQAPGFLDGIVAVAVAANQTAPAAARLVRAGSETTIDPAQASVASAAGSSARVALPANALVNPATGAAPSGMVTVRVTPIDPGADPRSMPGDFTTSTGATIESFGAINVTLKDNLGADLDLKSGSSATIRIPLASRSTDAPATIPLFFLDESTGRWVEEGSAVLTSSGSERWYEGTVTHFSTWNADRIADTVFVNGCVVNDAALVVSEGLAISTGLDYAGSAMVGVDAQGRFRVAMRRDGRATIHVEGANSSNSVVAGPSAADITLPACLVMSSAAQAPTIVQQPVAFAAQSGGSAYFGVVASGTRPLAYQWRRNGTPIANARGDVYFIPAVALADNGAVFDVVVSNTAGSVTSSGATLSVAAPVAPTITSQPASISVAAGAAASFSVTATGTAPLAYQWQRNGADIAGATSASYTLSPTALADSGAVFRVRISNAGGTAISANATLTVTGPALSAPTITAQPQDRTVAIGQTAQFSVSVTGSPAPAFQWRRNGTPIAGATASSYTTPAVTSSDNGAVFSVVVSNSQGSVTSSGATLTVNVGSVASRINLVRLLGLAPAFLDAGILPFEAMDNDTVFLDPATVCQQGTLSVTLNGAAVTLGQPVPLSGTVGAVAVACVIDEATYSGQTSVAFTITSRSPNPFAGTGTVTATNMRLTQRLNGVVIADITANGACTVSGNESTSGANTVFTDTVAPGAGATLRSEVSGLTATYVSGSVVVTTTENTASGDPVSLRLAYNNLTFTNGGVTYVGNGTTEVSINGSTVTASGQVLLTTNGVQLGRLFYDTDGVFKLQVDGTVQPFGATGRLARR